MTEFEGEDVMGKVFRSLAPELETLVENLARA